MRFNNCLFVFHRGGLFSSPLFAQFLDNNGDVDDHRPSSCCRCLLRWHRFQKDLSMDIVTLGFVKNLTISGEEGDGGGDAVVSFSVELTTPACPVKEVG